MAAHLEPQITRHTTRSESPCAESKQAYDDDYPAEQSASDKDSPTTYEYLTFETALPDFNALNNDPSAPRAPNLTKYDSPFGWSDARKNICLALSCVATFLAAYSAGVYSFASPILRERWGLSSVEYTTGVTCWCIGFAISPMFLAPFSEINGRRPVFLASGVVLLVADIGCAVTDSFAGMLVARFFQGAGASTFATIIGGVISDVYHAEHRNTPMALYSSGALSGTPIGPLCGGFIVQRVNWRWMWWTHAMALGILMLAMVVLFKETRGSVLLSRKAKVVNKYYDKLDEYTRQNHSERPLPSKSIRYKVASDENRATVARMIYLSVTTPFKLLATEPVVFFFSLWAAFAWGVLYMAFNVIPYVYMSTYAFNVEQQAGIFTAVVIGTIIAVTLSINEKSLLSLTFFSSTKPTHKSDSKPTTTTIEPHSPESRLHLPCLLSPLLPIGLFWFGWTSQPHIPWIIPTIALAISQIGIFSIYLAVFNYLADTYHRFASSALAGQSFCRNVLGAVFPLFTEQMFRRLGNGGAASCLGGIGVCLTLVPWVLVWKGREIRAKSKVASEILGKGQ